MYLKKKDFLEWACAKISEYNQNEKDADAVCKFGEKERWRAKMQVLEDMKRLVQSGAFDAPEMEHINAYWAREGLIKHQEAEVQRLRAALERIKKWTEDPELGTMYKIWNLANETLKGDGNDA